MAPPRLIVTRTMRRHDPEIIAALAEGSLDPAEAARLEREITADPRATA